MLETRRKTHAFLNVNVWGMKAHADPGPGKAEMDSV